MMDKKNPTILQMIIVLLVIAVICSAGVAAVYSVTKDPIAQARATKLQQTLSVVLPEHDNDPSVDTVTIKVDDQNSVFCYVAKKGGEVAGYAVKAGNNNGYNGLVEVLVGFDADGKVINTSPTTLAETPGLGQKAADSSQHFVQQFKGIDPASTNMTVKKDGGDIDAISAATITSRAYTLAVKTAYDGLMKYLGKSDGAQAVSGATNTANPNADETGIEDDSVSTNVDTLSVDTTKSQN